MVSVARLLVVNTILTVAVLVVALGLWFRTPDEILAPAKPEQRTKWVQYRDFNGDGWMDIYVTDFPPRGFDFDFDDDADLDLFVVPSPPESK